MGCRGAREFLAHKIKDPVLRDLIKEPLSVAELRKLARRAGDPKLLVAPKKRKEAERLDGDALIDWLAADGSRLRRPIIDTGKELLLGFTAETRTLLEEALV